MRGQPTGAFKCPRCGSTTWGDLNFCMECGQALIIECPKCGETWRYIHERAFCPGCGTRISKMRATG
ncbi:MAG: zinc ribbon domain-containing protein [Pseudomonadota bacterium]